MYCTTRYLNSVVWELTLRCNAHCVHCGSSAGKDRKDNLTDEEIFRVCDELSEIGCRKVTLIGGEMFLHPAWRRVVEKLSAKDIEVAIVTNALLLNEDVINFLAQNKVSVIGISLDGADAALHDGIRRVPGLFDKIMSLSDIIEKSKIPAVAITTVTNLNIDALSSFRDLLVPSYFRGWQLQIGAPFGRMQQDISLNEFEHYLLGVFLACSQRRIDPRVLEIFGMHCVGYYSKLIPNSVANYLTNWEGCPAGRYVLGIRSNGKVIGCLSIYDDSFIEGDLRKNSIREIWESKNFCSWNNRLQRYKNLKGFCKDCAYGIACCSGCSSMAHSYTGDVGETKLCFHKTEVKYENYVGNDAYSQMMRQLVNGEISEQGQLILENRRRIDKSFIENLDVSAEIKRQLKQLL